jgi:hypothetical protein
MAAAVLPAQDRLKLAFFGVRRYIEKCIQTLELTSLNHSRKGNGFIALPVVEFVGVGESVDVTAFLDNGRFVPTDEELEGAVRKCSKKYHPYGTDMAIWQARFMDSIGAVEKAANDLFKAGTIDSEALEARALNLEPPGVTCVLGPTWDAMQIFSDAKRRPRTDRLGLPSDLSIYVWGCTEDVVNSAVARHTRLTPEDLWNLLTSKDLADYIEGLLEEQVSLEVDEGWRGSSGHNVDTVPALLANGQSKPATINTHSIAGMARPQPESTPERRLAGASVSQPATISASVLKTSSPTPTLKSWGDLTITFLSDERVQVSYPGFTETLNYAEFGLADGRSETPKKAWTVLRTLAVNDGALPRPAHFVVQKTGNASVSACDDVAAKTWALIRKDVQLLRGLLRERFGLSVDPIPNELGTGFRTSFRINRSGSFHS